MTAFYLLALFPLLMVTGFAIAHGLLDVLYKDRAATILARWGGWFFLFLLGFPMVATVRYGLETGTFADMGLRTPEVLSLPPWLAIGLTVVGAWLLGVVLYVQELVLSAKLVRWFGARRVGWTATVVHGESESLRTHRPSFLHYMSLSTILSFVEEFLWRGFLLFFLISQLGMQTIVAVLVTSVLFGVNHAYFGLRNVGFKTVDGLVWAGLVLATSSLLGAVVSHFTFQYLVWRRLARPSARRVNHGPAAASPLPAPASERLGVRR